MAYFGKEYKFEKDENFDAFIKSLPLSAEESAKYTNYKPNVKIEKNGDTYTLSLIHPGNTQVLEFKSGVEFEENVRDDIVAKTTITVNGNTVTQVKKIGPKGTFTFTREFSDNALVVLYQFSNFDGIARRYYTV
ncbi:fatty acid-binding protein 1-like [Aphomia sociella]